MYNRYCSAAERIEFMGWVNEGMRQQAAKINIWNAYELRFFAIKGAEVYFFITPP
ncbi:Gamma-1-syntrophin, partial [Sarracenia purpurea var. burkii]